MENLKLQIAQLFNKAEWSNKEKQWLLKYLENTDTEELRDLMKQQFEDELKHPGEVDEEITNKMLQNIHRAIANLKKTNKSRLVKIWIINVAAASLIGFLVLGSRLLFRNNTKKEIVTKQVTNIPHKDSIIEGSNKILLTLADGATIDLEDAKNGTLTQQGDTKVFKNNGKLIYSSITKIPNKILYNSLVTPPGRQYQVELPDGTEVWLNGTSSIHFQTAFVGKERRVEVTGEAYFEVAKNSAMPFIVNVSGAEIRVLGTHFNVMAYKDEASLKTTLLEGRIEFVNGSSSSILKPGQQSRLEKNGKVDLVNSIDLAETIAWKNGIFDFEGTDIESVTRQLSRWYNVEIVYSKKIEEFFWAKIPRSTRLEEVLKALELTGKVRFKIEGKKIIVTQ